MQQRTADFVVLGVPRELAVSAASRRDAEFFDADVLVATGSRTGQSTS